MSSKFGVLGDVDKLLGELRRDVSHAASSVGLVRQTLQEAPPGEWTRDLLNRICNMLMVAEDKLTSLIQR